MSYRHPNSNSQNLSSPVLHLLPMMIETLIFTLIHSIIHQIYYKSNYQAKKGSLSNYSSGISYALLSVQYIYIRYCPVSPASAQLTYKVKMQGYESAYSITYIETEMVFLDFCGRPQTPSFLLNFDTRFPFVFCTLIKM